MLLAAIGRMCLSLIFILAGISQVFDWTGTEAYFTNGLIDLLNRTQNMPRIQDLIHTFTPYSQQLLVAGVIFELLGGLLLFLGLQVRLAAFLLILFLIPTTLVFHDFWFLEGPDRSMQMINFMKNLSIFGGLLYVLDMGKGKGLGSSKKERGSEK